MKKNFWLIATFLLVCTNTFGREGVYLEFKISSQSVTGTSKTYSLNGDSRVEMTMQNPAMPAPMSIITLVLGNNPDKVYGLNDKDKTYTETDVTKSPEQKNVGDDEEYEITVLGKETVNGYAATHVNIVYKKTQRSSEMWLSKDVKGYADYTHIKSKYLGGHKFFDALKEKGAEGFVVRMMLDAGRGGKMQMDLVKAEKRDMPTSLFSLDGYTKTASMGGAPGMERPDIGKLQKMTPEERKKYIEEMKAKYQQPH